VVMSSKIFVVVHSGWAVILSRGAPEARSGSLNRTGRTSDRQRHTKTDRRLLRGYKGVIDTEIELYKTRRDKMRPDELW
jgi:hypothetical protein